MMKYTEAMLKHHFCEQDEGWMEYDVRGAPIAFVCDTCIDVKMRPYRELMLKNINSAKAEKDSK